MPLLLRKKAKETRCYRYARIEVHLFSVFRSVAGTVRSFVVLFFSQVRRQVLAMVVRAVDVQCLKQEVLKFRNP